MSENNTLIPEDLGSNHEKEIRDEIGYPISRNLVPDYERLTRFIHKYLEVMNWQDLNWLEDVHMGYEEDRPADFLLSVVVLS